MANVLAPNLRCSMMARITTGAPVMASLVGRTLRYPTVASVISGPKEWWAALNLNAPTRPPPVRPASIEFDTRYADVYLRPNSSDVISLTAIVLDNQGGVVADGTPVNISTSLGNVAPVAVNAASAANANVVVSTVNG